jgi:hypothetical protein
VAAAGGASAVPVAAAAGGGAGALGSPVVVLQQLLAEGGFGALYRGLGAATLRLVPMAIVSFGMYEVMRQQILRFEMAVDAMQAREQHRKVHVAMQQHEQQQQQRRREQEQYEQQLWQQGKEQGCGELKEGARQEAVGVLVVGGGHGGSGGSCMDSAGCSRSAQMAANGGPAVSMLGGSNSSGDCLTAAGEQDDCGCVISAAVPGLAALSGMEGLQPSPPAAGAAGGGVGAPAEPLPDRRSSVLHPQQQRWQVQHWHLQPLLLAGAPVAAAAAGALASRLGGRR